MGFFTGSRRRNVARSSAKATVARHVESHQSTMARPSNGTTGNTPHCQIPLSFQIMKWRRLPHRPPPPVSRERARLSTACALRRVRGRPAPHRPHISGLTPLHRRRELFQWVDNLSLMWVRSAFDKSLGRVGQACHEGAVGRSGQAPDFRFARLRLEMRGWVTLMLGLVVALAGVLLSNPRRVRRWRRSRRERRTSSGTKTGEGTGRR
jgi:hypothetical protein